MDSDNILLAYEVAKSYADNISRRYGVDVDDIIQEFIFRYINAGKVLKGDDLHKYVRRSLENIAITLSSKKEKLFSELEKRSGGEEEEEGDEVGVGEVVGYEGLSIVNLMDEEEIFRKVKNIEFRGKEAVLMDSSGREIVRLPPTYHSVIKLILLGIDSQRELAELFGVSAQSINYIWNKISEMLGRART